MFYTLLNKLTSKSSKPKISKTPTKDKFSSLLTVSLIYLTIWENILPYKAKNELFIIIKNYLVNSKN